MFTVARLGVNGALRRSLTNTNCIESMISAVRVVTGRVKHWHDGDMKKRWIATGMIEAQRSFRRVRGHTHMATLAALITDTINPVAPDNYAQCRCLSSTGITPHFNKKRTSSTAPTRAVNVAPSRY